MTGLEKIIEKIEQKSKIRCNEIIDSAQKEAGDIIEKANADAEVLMDENRRKSKLNAEQTILMAHSGAQQKAKRILLAARIKAVNETLAEVARALSDMDEDAYFRAITNLAAANAMKGNGVMRLSSKDLNRLPKNLEAEINKKLLTKAAAVTIDKTPAPVKDGFILVYGDIEINCTFEALIESRRDELKEKIAEIIL